MEEFPASKVHLQPATCNLTYSEVSQQTYVNILLGNLGVDVRQNWGRGGGGIAAIPDIK